MSIDQRFEVGDHPRLEVRIQAGRIDIDTGDEGTVEVSVSGRAEGEIEVTQMGDTVVVRQAPGGWMRAGSVRVYARVPEGTDLDLSVAAADMWLNGQLGDATIKTAAGDLTAERLGRVEVKTASGDIKIDEIHGSAQLSSASGDIWVGTAAGRLSASLASGDLRAGEVAGDVRVNTASGDVRVDRCGGRELAFKSVSGDVRVGLPAGCRVDADITTLSGRIVVPDRSEPSDGERRQVRLTAKSVSGDIEIVRA